MNGFIDKFENSFICLDCTKKFCGDTCGIFYLVNYCYLHLEFNNSFIIKIK